MGILDILQQVLGAQHAQQGQVDDQHFDQIAREAPPDVFGQGVAEAFKSDQTPAFGNMIEQMFGQSSPDQRAGVLNQILASLGPAAAGALAGGALGKILQGGLAGLGGGAAPQAGTAAPQLPQITPDQAAKVSPSDVNDIVQQARQQDPGIMDQLGRFYADHPHLVKGLGGVAAMVAIAKMQDALTRRS